MPRAHHPVLFLLILSRETELALKLIKALPAEPDAQKQCAALCAKFFPQAKVDLADILGLLRNLQRAIPLIVAVDQMSGLNTKTLKRMVADLKGGHIAHADKKFHRRINVTVEALRKIALLDIDRHNKIENGSEAYKFERCKTDRETLDRYLCLTAEDTNYSARVEKHCHDEAVLNLPTAPPPSNAPPKRSNVKPTRQTGRGGSREANLANYYGFSRDELALLLAIITNNEAGTIQMTARQTAFAAAILAVAGHDPDAESDIRDRQTNRLKESEALAFPSSGQMLHGVGFSLESWKDPEHDKPLWKTLTKSNGGTDDYARFFLQCRDYFYILTHRVKVLRSLDRAARVFCYMAQCVWPSVD